MGNILVNRSKVDWEINSANAVYQKSTFNLAIEIFWVDLSSIWIDSIYLEELLSYGVYCLAMA
jgi:hypothetical protein